MSTEISLADLGETIVTALARAERGAAAVREDRIVAGRALLIAQEMVYTLSSNQSPAMRAARWTVWLGDLHVSVVIATKCMKLASAPDPQQALAEDEAKGRERAQKAQASRALAEANRDLSPTAARMLAALIECLNMEDADDALEWALTTARRVMNKAA